ncbi:MAG TPA: exodeoxyribonuclease VII large subunit, partial [Rhodanobacter sp.]|nr:exodeoxyribonuclease VII large subunit [Rhodanobacter sp.]
RARVGLYEPRGEFQLVAEYMEPAGAGALQRAFEELKARLDAEGLFGAERKRPLPRFARRIGVITSATGAAVRDVISVLSRRWPLAEVDVLAVPVQGREAPPAIVGMLRKASLCGRYDVLLLTRGGGSLEDLWAFNEEAVARAIHASAVPVVSAVGHEIDFSISDFVADLRAPTPSAAAELLVPDVLAISRQLRDWQRRLLDQQRNRHQERLQRLDLLLARLRNQRPQARLARDRERLAHLRHRLASTMHARTERDHRRLDQVHSRLLARHPRHMLPLLAQRLREQQRRLQRSMQQRDERAQARLQGAARALHAVSPLATLERGYAIVFDGSGKVLRSTRNVATGTRLRARLVDGELAVQVLDEAPAS